MRHRIVDSLIDRHNAKVAPTLRPILKGRNAFRRQSVRQHDRPTFLKGVHNGQFFRIKLPNPSSQVSRLPPLPSILPVPKSLMGLWGEKSKNSLEILFPREGTQDSLFQRLLRWLSFNWPTMLLNFGSVCTLMAFTRSDVLELRTLSATGSISNALYRYTQKPILWITIAWPSLFATVNGVKIIEILHERNAEVHMDEEQERIYVEYFLQHGVTPKQFQRIQQSAEIRTISEGDIIIRKGERLDQIYLIVNGSTQAHIMGRHLTAQSTAADAKVKKLGGDSGAWVGEMAFLDRMGEKELEKRRPKPPLTEKGSVALPKPDESQSHPETKVPKNGPETTASQQSKTAHVLYTVLAKEDCTVWRWSFDEMEALIESSTDLRGAITRAMTSSIVGKVVNMTLSRTNAMPHWSTWLSDWVRDDGAEIQVVQEAQGVPTENGSSENKINDGVTDNAPLVLHPVEDMLQ